MTHLLSHLSYVAITSNDVEASVEFYEQQVGLTVVDRVDGNVYLRCWGDYYRYSVVIVPGDEPGMHAMAWRSSSADALAAAVQRIEDAGVKGEWFDGHKIGRAYRFTGPFGHVMELHWDVEHVNVRDGKNASIFPDRTNRRSSVAGAPRQLDHVTLAAQDVDEFARWYSEVLGFRLMARTQLEEAPISVFSVLTTNEKSHDLGVVLDGSTRSGRINHYAFWWIHVKNSSSLLMSSWKMAPTLNTVLQFTALANRTSCTTVNHPAYASSSIPVDTETTYPTGKPKLGHLLWAQIICTATRPCPCR